jgi:hypothetical protein
VPGIGQRPGQHLADTAGTARYHDLHSSNYALAVQVVLR